MIAYIQVNDEGLPYSAHGAAAARGFELLGHGPQPFRRDQLPELDLSPETVYALSPGPWTVHPGRAQAGDWDVHP